MYEAQRFESHENPGSTAQTAKWLSLFYSNSFINTYKSTNNITKKIDQNSCKINKNLRLLISLFIKDFS